MSRDFHVIALIFFVLGCAILIRLDDVIYVVAKSKIIVVEREKSGRTIEGEFKPVDG